MSSNAAGTGVGAVGFEEAGVREHPGHHADGAEEESWAAAPAVDVEEGGNGHDDVDYVLDRGGNEQVVPGEAGHGEDVGYVVHYESLVERRDEFIYGLAYSLRSCLSIETISA